MQALPKIEVPKWALTILNHVSEIERKLVRYGDLGNARRNVEKIKDSFAEEGVFYEDPMGQEFKDTRTDLDATITGIGTDNLVVIEVIKPIIRIGTPDLSRVVQRGIVLVQSAERGEPQ